MFKTKACSGRRSSARVLIQPTFARIAALGFAGILAACGGGGGGGGNSAGGASGPTPLVYAGKTTPAVISATNAAELTANIVGGAGTSSAFSGVAPVPEGGGVTELDRRLIRAIRARASVPKPASRQLTSEPVNQTDFCDDNTGTVRTTGDVSQSGPGTLNFVWTNCLTGDTRLDGSASVTVRIFDQVFGILDGTFNFVRVTLTSPAASGTVSGELLLQVDPAANKETTTSNLITLDSNGRMTKADNLVVVDVFDDISATDSRFAETMTGRLFDSIEGFVDIATDTPLVFDTQTQLFASAGQVVLTGVTSHARAFAVSFTVVRLDLDLDGDNTYEGTAFLRWTELRAPSAADLGDRDRDGMHNSWEIVNGLNPDDPLDAGKDSDGDGATNLAEYKAGTNPQDGNSHP